MEENNLLVENSLYSLKDTKSSTVLFPSMIQQQKGKKANQLVLYRICTDRQLTYC